MEVFLHPLDVDRLGNDYPPLWAGNAARSGLRFLPYLAPISVRTGLVNIWFRPSAKGPQIRSGYDASPAPHGRPSAAGIHGAPPLTAGVTSAKVVEVDKAVGVEIAHADRADLAVAVGLSIAR